MEELTLHNRFAVAAIAAAIFVVERIAHNRVTDERQVDADLMSPPRFEIDVEQPHTLGADRALNCIAAHATVGGDMIVVDFGTATKFEAVDYTGAYKGGIIAPGINLSLDALVGNTAKLPRIAIRAPDTSSVIGRNTEDQMLIGVFWGYVAMMEGLIARMKAEIGRPVTVVATGGLAILFDEKTDIFDRVDADLTIRGLQLLADRTGQR